MMDVLILVLLSDEFGREEFPCDDWSIVLAKMQTLYADAMACDDGVERIIGVIVHPKGGE